MASSWERIHVLTGTSMLASLTGFGLSAAAGLNAYIPLLVVGLLSRFTSAVELPEPYAWMGNGWVLAILGALLTVELVVDKVPVVDTINDTLQTFVRPAAGGAIFAATAAAEQIDASPWMQDNPWAGWLLGIVVAGLVHVLKASARPVIDAGTVGTGTPVVSAAEDVTSLGVTLIAVFAPVLVVIVLGLLAWTGFVVWRRRRRRRRGRSRGRADRLPAGR